MLRRISLLVAGFGLLFLAVGAKANSLDRKTTVTFNQPVDFPGATLWAGTYVFKIVDVPGVRNIVRVFNADETEVITTFVAVPRITDRPYEKPNIVFEERPAGTPMAVHNWFFTGEGVGIEFPFR